MQAPDSLAAGSPATRLAPHRTAVSAARAPHKATGASSRWRIPLRTPEPVATFGPMCLITSGPRNPKDSRHRGHETPGIEMSEGRAVAVTGRLSEPTFVESDTSEGLDICAYSARFDVPAFRRVPWCVDAMYGRATRSFSPLRGRDYISYLVLSRRTGRLRRSVRCGVHRAPRREASACHRRHGCLPRRTRFRP